LLSPGTTTLGTRNTTDPPDATHASPIARTPASFGQRFQFAGRLFTSTTVTIASSNITGISR
jgi:hypothetical protein